MTMTRADSEAMTRHMNRGLAPVSMPYGSDMHDIVEATMRTLTSALANQGLRGFGDDRIAVVEAAVIQYVENVCRDNV